MLTRKPTSSVSRPAFQSPTSLSLQLSTKLPDPTTTGYAASQMSTGFTGPINTTKNVARIYGRGELTLWSGWVTGTEAKLTMSSDYGDFDGGVQVAVDGGAFSNAPRSGQVYTLFTGLAHAKRFVEFRYADGLGDVPFVNASGTVLTVTGQPPAIITLANRVALGADSSTGLYSGAIIPNVSGYTPALQAPKGQVYGSNIGSVKIKGAFTNLVVTLNGSYKVGVSKNGGVPTFYTATDDGTFPVRAIVVPCDGSTSTYNVWDDGCYRNTGGDFSVSVDSTFLDIGVRRRLDQYGDSATFGSGPGASSVNTETMAVAAAMGFVGSTNGVSGMTIGPGKALIDSVLPLRTVNSSDVAILALGGNNAESGIDSTAQIDYALCIDKLLAKGYGKVLCRGVLPVPAAQSLVDAANVILKSVMVAKADARLIWIDPTTWTGFETQDGVHPTANGYLTLATYATPAYKAALGL